MCRAGIVPCRKFRRELSTFSNVSVMEGCYDKSKRDRNKKGTVVQENLDNYVEIPDFEDFVLKKMMAYDETIIL
ncbi:hypothetical protein CEXT_773281 [Caerostris extrusa]|uniref:Uncharacterized protein n=1 Tax=Caerostris extrusa TaxID=172846 RepID=A0AAV4MSS4_CAEEX|nr:hypothetical protein CEXT_773281 [Caerostris extrusa]